MPRHLLIVATEFRVAGFLLGIPSFLSLAAFAVSSFPWRRSVPPDPSQPLDIQTYGLVGLLANGGRAVGKVLELLGDVASWIALALAIISLVTMLISIVLYLTGRGIGHHATWARILGILISLGSLILSVGLLLALRRNLAPLACLPMGAALYTLWVLCWRFA